MAHIAVSQQPRPITGLTMVGMTIVIFVIVCVFIVPPSTWNATKSDAMAATDPAMDDLMALPVNGSDQAVSAPLDEGELERRKCFVAATKIRQDKENDKRRPLDLAYAISRGGKITSPTSRASVAALYDNRTDSNLRCQGGDIIFVDLGSPRTIHAVEVDLAPGHQGPPEVLYLEVETQPRKWLYAASLLGGCNAMQIAPPISARRWRMRISGDASRVVMITELRFIQ